jgi:hypothetical protein
MAAASASTVKDVMRAYGMENTGNAVFKPLDMPLIEAPFSASE